MSDIAATAVKHAVKNPKIRKKAVEVVADQVAPKVVQAATDAVVEKVGGAAEGEFARAADLDTPLGEALRIVMMAAVYEILTAYGRRLTKQVEEGTV